MTSKVTFFAMNPFCEFVKPSDLIKAFIYVLMDKCCPCLKKINMPSLVLHTALCLVILIISNIA